MNDAVSWLPGNAESTRVIQASAQFQPKDEIPATVVYERAGGVTPQDMASVTAQIAKFNALAPVARPSVGPIPSRDKSAIRVEVPINAGSAGWDKLSAAVTDMRSIAKASPAGLSVHRVGPAIFASGSTVIAGMLCLLVSSMNSTQGLGPVAAVGIAVGLMVMLTLLPALLVIFGRWFFWPVHPTFGSVDHTATGVWAKVGARIARAPRATWIATSAALIVAGVGVFQLNAVGLQNKDAFFGTPDSVVGEQVLADHFPAGAGQPVIVIANADRATAVRTALTGVGGISGVAPPVVKGDRALLAGTLAVAPDSQAAIDTVGRVRDAVHQVPGAQAIAGGDSATRGDILQAASNDNKVIIPLILFVVFLILMLLLRAVVAPLILIGTVVLSFGAAMGLSSLVFRHVFNFAGADSSLPLFVFVFLVALGIDYNIFLMTRVHEEARQFGTRRGALIGLAATGGVITSAGLVLAGTFSVLATLPVVAFAEIGFAVALGVLLDTLIVRSVLVTALNLDVGRHMWWPSSLANKPDSEELPRPATVTHRGAASGALRRTQTD